MKDFICTCLGAISGLIAKIVTNDPFFAILTAFIGGFFAYFGTTLGKIVLTYFVGAYKRARHEKTTGNSL